MNRIKTVLAVFAVLASTTGATDVLPMPEMTPDELAAAIEEAQANGDQGMLYTYLEQAYEKGAAFALDGETDKALQMVELALKAEPNIGRYITSDERFANLADSDEYQKLLRDAEIAAIEQNITVPLGAPAPDFELEDFSGAVYKLSDFRDKVVLLNIWATWCPPCQAEIPDLIEIQDEYGTGDFAILSISVDRDEDGGPAVHVVSEFAAEMGINYPVLMDDGEAASAYIAKAGGIPETYIIDKEGNVAYFILGGAEKDAFVSAIEPVLK
jgi:thiol-disulfide isomerase/thioredoxin